MHSIKKLILAASLTLAYTAIAIAQDIPAPINGVTFQEWAAANARIANNMDRADVEKTLGVNDTQFKEIDDGFTQALKNEKDDSQRPLAQAYGDAFANPNNGRFASSETQVALTGKLATFEDYARVQGHLQAATKLGIDPQKILEEHGLTVYEFSQEAGQWVQKLAAQARAGGDGQAILRWHERLAFYEAEYSKQPAKE
jgi:hypothetical protein